MISTKVDCLYKTFLNNNLGFSLYRTLFFAEWYFKDEDLQEKVRKFKQINVAGVTLMIAGALSALGLGILVALQLANVMSYSTTTALILNITFGSGSC